MMFNIIRTYSEFVLNETLKTNDIDYTIDNIISVLTFNKFDFYVSKKENKIELVLYDFNNTPKPVDKTMDLINSVVINRNGWFPSTMMLTNIQNRKNILSYDEDYLKNNKAKLVEVKILFEPKFDKKVNTFDTMYHLTKQSNETNILNNGLIPKSKSKQTKHLDRIYLCENVTHCYDLIPQLIGQFIYLDNDNKYINNKWIIFEVNLKGMDIDLYEDPNFKNKGFYVVDNIPKNRLKIYDKEK